MANRRCTINKIANMIKENYVQDEQKLYYNVL